MRQAITVRFVGPTERNMENRWRASCAAGAKTVDQDDSANPRLNARLAAMALVSKLGWGGVWHGGVTRNGDYVFVQVTDDAADGFNLPRTMK